MEFLIDILLAVTLFNILTLILILLSGRMSSPIWSIFDIRNFSDFKLNTVSVYVFVILVSIILLPFTIVHWVGKRIQKG